MENIASPAAPPLVDNPTAPEIFADEATGFFLHNGNLSITFSRLELTIPPTPAPVSRVVVGRIVLPVNGALYPSANCDSMRPQARSRPARDRSTSRGFAHRGRHRRQSGGRRGTGPAHEIRRS
jgi:hypothetical protein